MKNSYSVIKNEPVKAMIKIINSIKKSMRDHKYWAIGQEPFYRISQTVFALRTLIWHNKGLKNNLFLSKDWLFHKLSSDDLPNYTRTFAWPIILLDEIDEPAWENLMQHFIEKLILLQNIDGSWGHGNLNKNISGSGEAHPFSTALGLWALSKSKKINNKNANPIKNAVSWLVNWCDNAPLNLLASWSISLIALKEADSHDVNPNFFEMQTQKIAGIVNRLENIEIEIIPNAARHLDSPYFLLTPAWLLIVLSKLGPIDTLTSQLKLIRILFTLIQKDGSVGCIENDPNPHLYCSFNVYYALREFLNKYGKDKLLMSLINNDDLISKLTKVRSRTKAVVFVGSSKEGLQVAYKIQENFEYDNFDCVIWSQNIFKPSKTSIESLEESAKDFDFAVFVLTPDDFEQSRGELKSSIRDNVIFEFGFFMGEIGRERVFGIHPREDIKIPSDLINFTTVTYDAARFLKYPSSAIASACNKIREELLKLGPR